MDFLSLFKKSTSSQVFDYLPDGLVLTNLIGRVLFVNSHAKELMNINEGDSLPAALDTTMNMIEGLVENKNQSVFKVIVHSSPVRKEGCCQDLEEHGVPDRTFWGRGSDGSRSGHAVKDHGL